MTTLNAISSKTLKVTAKAMNVNHFNQMFGGYHGRSLYNKFVTECHRDWSNLFPMLWEQNQKRLIERLHDAERTWASCQPNFDWKSYTRNYKFPKSDA